MKNCTRKNGMVTWGKLLVLVGCLSGVIGTVPAFCDVPGSRYVRITKDATGQPQGLETSIVRLVPGAATATEGAAFPADGYVDLVAAVHVGELAYYQALNQRFKDYDAVLYELVAPKNFDVSAQRAEANPGNQHPISMLQLGMRSVLKLEFQLDQIDYRAANLVHADMSPEELSSSMAARNESFLGMMLKAMAAASAKESRGEGKPPDMSSMFLLMFGDSRAIALRRLMAREFEDIDVLLDAINGTEGSSIITERNKVAVRELAKALAKGKRKIAIFYGGAHMPDFERQLAKAHGLTPSAPEWLLAWRLAP
jgi:hypothetical protein